MTFAVVKTGGKQYVVRTGDIIAVEKMLAGVGDQVALPVLASANKGKTDCKSTATVTAEVLEHKKGAKILIFKKKRRKNHRRKTGHRQNYTILKILGLDQKSSAVSGDVQSGS